VAALDTLPAAEWALPLAFGDGLRWRDVRGTLVIMRAQAGRYRDARALAERLSALGVPANDASFGMAMVHVALGEPETARRCFAQASEICRAVGHSHVEGFIIHYELTWAVLPYQTERVDERWRLVEETRRAWEAGSGIERSTIPESAALPLQYIEGDWQKARTVALAARAAFGTSAGAHVHKRVLGHIAREQGDTELAWAVVREQLPAGVETAYGAINFVPALEFQRLAAMLAMDDGNLDLAQTWLETHDRWLAWNDAVLGRSEGQALWARYHQMRGDARRAYQYATKALATATEPRQPLALLAAHRLLGELNIAMGRIAYAATHLDAALGLATACAAPYERALTLLAFAELRAGTGQRAEAMALLDEVRATCGPLGAVQALARADALAARMMTAKGTVSTVSPAGLTPREIDVLRLLAAGHTNRAIGDALFLSERTVQVHVRHILAKTGAENRAGATAFAVRHDLA
jgi:DNA-binding CsgD family transcriptional regulator/tetratricopeptide (TPR) repeat protein